MLELKTTEIEQVSGGVSAYPVINPIRYLPIFPVQPNPPFQGGPIHVPPEL